MKMTTDDILTAVYSDLESSVDYANTTLRDIRKKAWDRVLNRRRGDEMPGRSSVNDTTIRDQGYAMLATIMPAYAGEEIVNFQPAGPDDVDQADAESRALNSIFVNDNSGYLALHQMVSDCLWFRNGILKCWIEEKDVVTTRRFIKQKGVTAAMIMAGKQDGGDWEIEAEDDEEVTFRITREEQQVRVESIEPSYFYVDPNQQDQILTEAAFMAERTFFTRSDLLEMGVPRKTVEELEASEDESVTDGVGTSNYDITAKYIDGIADIGQASTWAAERIETYWIHGLYDVDGDGIAEKWRFLVSHRHMLLEDAVDVFPYASATGWPVPHRWSGLGLYDLLKDTEDSKTHARRQLNDNMSMANNQRPILDPGRVEMEDVTTAAPGRAIRRKEGATVDFVPVMDITSNSLAYLQYMGEVTEDQSGASLQLQSGNHQSMKDISGLSAEMQLAPREQLAAQVSRNIAQTGITQLFLIMHQLLRNDWQSPIMYQKSGQWQQTMPAEWPERTRLNIVPGLSPGERRRKAANLQQVVQTQMMLIQGGSANITTDWNGVHSALADWMSALELDATEDYFLDPDGPKSQQAQQAAGQQSQQQQQMQQQMMQMQMQLEQQKLQIDAQKVANDKADDDADNEFDRLKLAAEMDMKEAELVTQAASAAASGADGGTRDSAANEG